MEYIFRTFNIRFHGCDSFNKALDMNHLADDIGHSDMVLVYSNEFFRDRFVRFLTINEIVDIEFD